MDTLRDLVGCTLVFVSLFIAIIGLQAASVPIVLAAVAMAVGGWKISTLS